jgi:putative transposase
VGSEYANPSSLRRLIQRGVLIAFFATLFYLPLRACNREMVSGIGKWVPMRILASCLMPNHWRLVLYPRADGDLSEFLRRITLTHTQRYHARTRTVGYGHVYQGRYKSLLVESDHHFLTVVRYVDQAPFLLK